MTYDHDLHIEALQADLDAAKERYARLLKEHEALKTHHEGALHMNAGFAQQVVTLMDRIQVLQESQSSLIADLVSAHTDLARYKKDEDRKSHLFDI